MMYKTPTFAEPQQYNRPFSTGQLSAFIIQTLNWDVATRSERKNNKSCNKNAIKNRLRETIACINDSSIIIAVFRYFLPMLSCKFGKKNSSQNDSDQCQVLPPPKKKSTLQLKLHNLKIHFLFRFLTCI